MPPIEVLQVIPELDPGGAERVLLNLCRLLPRDRFHVSVAALDGRGPLAQPLREAGCTVHDLDVRSRWPFGGARPLARLIRDLRPDILHSHLFRAHLAAAGAARKRPVPVTIATEHQADPRRWAVWLLHRATRRSTIITAVSEGVREHLLRCGFAPERVRTLANGIDVAEIDRAAPLSRSQLGLPADAAVAIFVGRPAHQKGLDILLRAMQSLAASRPELHLLVVGGRPRPAAGNLAPAGRVHFLGWRGDVPALLKAANLAVLPSRWEGLSLVLLEAMATALPVVATQVEGQSEVIENGVTGLLVPPEDSAALAAAIDRVLSESDAARRLGEAAREEVRRHYTAEAMAARYAALYEELLKSSAAPRR